MVICDSCGKDVEVLTKATGTCLKCANEEISQGTEAYMTENDQPTKLAMMRAVEATETMLAEEGYLDI